MSAVCMFSSGDFWRKWLPCSIIILSNTYHLFTQIYIHNYHSSKSPWLVVLCLITKTHTLSSSTWQKDGNPLARDRTIVNGGNLTIVNIHEEDRGFYQCVASNEAATISSETELMIENTAPRAPYNLTAQATKNSISVKWIPGFIKPRLEYSVWWVKFHGS